MSTSTKSLNVILFGETGVGKSSLVNLIAGAQVARTSPDSNACTMSYKSHSFEAYGVSYNIWDTRGFDEADAETGSKGYLAAIKQAHQLIRDLTHKGGVDLLVLCHRAGRITRATRSNYRLFYEVLCENKVPIALVVTHLERQTRMEDWWDQNAEIFKKHEMVAATHACVTGLSGHSKSAESKQAIEYMLGQHDENGRFNMPPDEWFRRFLRRWNEFRGRAKGVKRNDMENFLRKRCELGIRDAHDVAYILADGYDSDASKQRRKFSLLSTPSR